MAFSENAAILLQRQNNNNFSENTLFSQKNGKKMKNVIMTFALTALMLTGYAKGGEIKTVVIKTNIYCSHCLQCGSCGANINDHIREEKGIKKVSVDPKTNTITVNYDSEQTNIDNIRGAINAAGYDADDKKAPKETVAKLDGCCKKK